MGEKIRNNGWELSSLVVAILGVVLEWNCDDAYKNIALLILWGVMEAFLVYRAVVSKHQIVKVYDMLCTMARNNKLHPIRQIVMIWYKKIHHEMNKVRIEKIKFVYDVSENEISREPKGERTLNVEYQLHFQVKETKKLYFGGKICFAFYMICENGDPQNVKLVYRMGGQEFTDRDVLVEAVTLNGESGDRMREFAGLYEMKVFLTDEMACKRRIDFSVSYEVEDHIFDKNPNYSFVIVPLNYSDHVKEIEIELPGISRDLVHNLSVQEVDEKERFYDWNTFRKSGDTYVLNEPLKPDKYASYFIQFDLENIYKKELVQDKTVEKEKSMITYRKAQIEDIPLLVDMRMNLLSSANKKSREELKHVEDKLYAYYRANLNTQKHVAYLAYDGDTVAGTGGMCYYDVLPTYHNPSGKHAYIINMYTMPQMRKRGIAGTILDMLVKEALAADVKYISLEATAEGRGLYEKYGFVPLPAEMQFQNEAFDARTE